MFWFNYDLFFSPCKYNYTEAQKILKNNHKSIQKVADTKHFYTVI